MAHVMQGQRLDFPQGFPPILRELIKKLWAQEPQQRCSLEKAHEDLEKFKEKL